MAVRVGVVALLILLCDAAGQTARSEAEPSVLTAYISTIEAHERVLVARGSSVAGLDGESFGVSTKVGRVPCPGNFRFETESEDLGTGAVTAYAADLRLSEFHSRPPGISCGMSVPPLPGAGSIVIKGGNGADPLRLTGRRGGFGNFIGKLRVSGFPACEVDYELRAEFDLEQWDRTFFYVARFDQAEFSYPGNVSPPISCR